MPFSKDISLKVNVIVRLELELIFYDIVVHTMPQRQGLNSGHRVHFLKRKPLGYTSSRVANKLKMSYSIPDDVRSVHTHITPFYIRVCVCACACVRVCACVSV